MCTLVSVTNCGGRGVTGGGDRSVSLFTRDTDLSRLSLTGHGSVCLHTQIHVLLSVTADRGSLADIAAARHAHRHPSSRAPQWPGGAAAVKTRRLRKVEPPCGRIKPYGRREVVKKPLA